MIAADLDLSALRSQLHAAVDEIVDRFVAGSVSGGRVPDIEPEVAAGDPTGAWDFRWPDGSIERFDSGRQYELLSNGGATRATVARTMRRAWGRERRRWVVFLDLGRRGTTSLYPAAEFVETDQGEVASTIPDPQHPRSKLSAGANLPERFERAVVKRADEVFGQVKHGPSLRLVLAADDEAGMLRHGLWVATTRGRMS